MGRLLEFVKGMPDSILNWIVPPEPPPAEIVLHDRAEKGLRVAQALGTPGWQDLMAEADVHDRLLLERFVAGVERPGEEYEPDLETWEQFVEYRGFVRGMRARGELARGLVQAGIEAERQLAEIEKARRGPVRKPAAGN